MNDVLIHYDELDEVNSQLKAIIKELKNVEDREDELQSAIGRPFGKSDLRDKAHEFESGWDDRRHKLAADIEKVQQHVAGVIKGFKKWDTETGNSETTTTVTAGANRPR